MSFSIVISSINDKNKAKEIANRVVEKKLAACVSIVDNVSSVYKWEKQLVEEDEVLLVFKIKTDLYKQLEEEILQIHPYKTPEIVQLPISDGLNDYLVWINENTLK